MFIKYYLLILLCSHCVVFTQRMKIAAKFENFQIDSENGSVKVLNSNSEKQSNNSQDYFFNFIIEVTQNEAAKKMIIASDKCRLDRSHCEKAFAWNLTNVRAVNYFINMKDQPWTTLFSRINPRFSLHNLKKGLYIGRNITIDTEILRKGFPGISNTCLPVKCYLVNKKSEKFLIASVDISFFEYTVENRKYSP